MSNDNNNVDLSLLVGGAGLLRKQIRSIIESILPCPGVSEQEWRGFVRQAGGPLVFAKKVVGDDNVSLLRSWLKRQRNEVEHTDFEGRLGLLPAIVYGQVNNLIAAREQDARPNGLSEAFKAIFEAQIARKGYGADAEKHLQPDFDRMVEYTDAAPKNRGLYLGRFCVDFFRKGKRPSGLIQVDSGSIRGWVLDIRHSADFNNPSIFTPVTKLGIGMAIYERDSVKEFIDRFYNEPARLIWRKIGYGAKQRWSVWMSSPKSGWIWSPLTYRSSRKVDRMAGGFQAYTRKVYVKGDRWISARKSGEDTLKVTVYQSVILDFHHQPKLLREVSQDTTPFGSPATPAGPFPSPVIPVTKTRKVKECPGCMAVGCTGSAKPSKAKSPKKREELVFSEAVMEKRKLIQVFKEVLMSPQEWGQTIKQLIANGWTCHEIFPDLDGPFKGLKEWCDSSMARLREKRLLQQLMQLPETY
jgi:hypothetical protein